MRKATAVVLIITTLLIFAVVGSVAARLLPNEQRGPQSVQTVSESTAAPSSGSETNQPEPVETAYLYPVFDLDYDDSWVANIPEFIGGYRVLYVVTPKSAACSDWPLITFHATQKSLQEYLPAAPDMNSLRAAVLAIPGVPSDIRLGFATARLDEAGVLLDKEEWEARRKRMNESMISSGCIFLGRPISVGPETRVVPGEGSGLSDPEVR